MTTQSQPEPGSMLNLRDTGVRSLDLLALLMETKSWRLRQLPHPSESKLPSCLTSAYILPVIVGNAAYFFNVFLSAFHSQCVFTPMLTVPLLPGPALSSRLGSGSRLGSVMGSLSVWYLPPTAEAESLSLFHSWSAVSVTAA